MRHNEMMESARKKSDETIDHLKRKLNSLQEVSPVVFEWLKCYQSGLSETLFSLSSSRFLCEKRQVRGVFTALCHVYLNADRLPVFQVLFNSDVQTVRDIVRSRSQSPVRYVSQKQVLTLKTWERDG